MISQGEPIFWDKTLGSGTYGIVYHAKTESGKEVAVKRNLVDKPLHGYHTACEMQILYRLRGHPNIVELCSISLDEPFENPMTPLGPDRFDQKDGHMHFVFELGKGDLNHFKFNLLSLDEIKPMLADILLGVEYIHGCGYIHRDLKPGNILLFPGNILKICDFGMAEPYSPGTQTLGVSTSWYRAPEVAMDLPYDQKIDIWSVGCIFFELLTGRPLVNSKTDTNSSVLRRIVQCIPMSEKSLREIKKNRSMKKTTLDYSYVDRLTGELTDDFKDLMSKLLAVDPDDRFTATQALDHSFFDSMRYKIDQIRAAFPACPVENVNLTVGEDSKIAAEMGLMIFRKLFTPGIGAWLKIRSLFQAVDLFERTKDIEYTKPKDKKQVEMRFLNCLYITTKYYCFLRSMVSFADMLKNIDFELDLSTSEYFDEMRKFEEEILFKNWIQINNPTCYNYAGRDLQPHEIKKFFDLYASLENGTEISWSEIWKRMSQE